MRRCERGRMLRACDEFLPTRPPCLHDVRVAPALRSVCFTDVRQAAPLLARWETPGAVPHTFAITSRFIGAPVYEYAIWYRSSDACQRRGRLEAGRRPAAQCLRSPVLTSGRRQPPPQPRLRRPHESLSRLLLSPCADVHRGAARHMRHEGRRAAVAARTAGRHQEAGWGPRSPAPVTPRQER